MVPAVLWNMLAWGMWGAFVLGLRYAIERRRQRKSNAQALGFLGDEQGVAFQEAR
jgi:heme exporter protein C